MALLVFEYELRCDNCVVSRGEIKATNIWHAMDQLTSSLWNEQNLRTEEVVIKQKTELPG